MIGLYQLHSGKRLGEASLPALGYNIGMVLLLTHTTVYDSSG